MDVFVWVLAGIVAGVLCNLVIPGRALGGFIGDMFAGLLGALVSGYMVWSVNLGHTLGNYLGWTLVITFMGAMGLAGLARVLSGYRQPGVIEDDRHPIAED